MIPLAQHAEELMDAAVGALNANGNVSDTTILVGQDGGIRVVDGAMWTHDAEAEYSVAAAYFIRNGLAGVTVEGRAGGRSCTIRTIPPAGAARILLGQPAGLARTCRVDSDPSWYAI